MPRVAKEVNCNENDIMNLMSIAESPVSAPYIAQRAKAILLCNEGKTNKEIAEELGVRNNTIGDWRNAYIKDGINGLKGKKRPGRRGSGQPDRKELVIQLVKQEPKEGKKWTAKALAAEAGTSTATVHRALRKEGVVLERRTIWEVPAENENAPGTVGLAGIFLSRNEKAIIIATSSEDNLSLSSGKFITRSGSYSSKLEGMNEENGHVTIADALESLLDADSTKENRSHKQTDLQTYINGVIGALKGRGEVMLHAIIHAEAGHVLPLTNHSNLAITYAPDFQAWATLTSLWVAPLCGREGKRIQKALSMYTNEHMELNAPVIWHAEPAPCERIGVSVPNSGAGGKDVFSDPGTENILRISAVIVNRDGDEIRREAEILNGVPGLDEICYGSTLELGNSVGMVERAISSSMKDVTKDLCEGYMKEALKKTAHPGAKRDK